VCSFWRLPDWANQVLIGGKSLQKTQGTKDRIIIKTIVRRGNIYVLKEGNTMKQKGRVCKGKAKLSKAGQGFLGLNQNSLYSCIQIIL